MIVEHGFHKFNGQQIIEIYGEVHEMKTERMVNGDSIQIISLQLMWMIENECVMMDIIYQVNENGLY